MVASGCLCESLTLFWGPQLPCVPEEAATSTGTLRSRPSAVLTCDLDPFLWKQTSIKGLDSVKLFEKINEPRKRSLLRKSSRCFLPPVTLRLLILSVSLQLQWPPCAPKYDSSWMDRGCRGPANLQLNSCDTKSQEITSKVKFRDIYKCHKIECR